MAAVKPKPVRSEAAFVSIVMPSKQCLAKIEKKLNKAMPPGSKITAYAANASLNPATDLPEEVIVV